MDRLLSLRLDGLACQARAWFNGLPLLALSRSPFCMACSMPVEARSICLEKLSTEGRTASRSSRLEEGSSFQSQSSISIQSRSEATRDSPRICPVGPSSLRNRRALSAMAGQPAARSRVRGLGIRYSVGAERPGALGSEG